MARQGIPFETPGNHLIVVQGSVDGATGLRLILDTGSGLELVSRSLFERLKLTRLGETEVPRLNGESVAMERAKVGKIGVGGVLELRDVGVAVTDHFDDWLKDFGRIDGALSLRALADRPFTLDFNANMLYLEDEESVAERAAKGRAVEIEFDQAGPEVLTISAVADAFGAYRGRFTIDTSTASTILSQASLAKLGLREDSPSLRRVQGWSLAGQPQTRYYARMAGKVALGEAASEDDPTICFQKLARDGVLGLNFLRGKIVTFDLPGCRLIFG